MEAALIFSLRTSRKGTLQVYLEGDRHAGDIVKENGGCYVFQPILLCEWTQVAAYSLARALEKLNVGAA